MAAAGRCVRDFVPKCRLLLFSVCMAAGLGEPAVAQTTQIVLNHTTALVFDSVIAGPADDPATPTRDEPNHNYDSFYAMTMRGGASTRSLSLLQIHGFLSNLRIPPGSTIHSATLRFYLHDDLASGHPQTVRVHRMLAPWTTDPERPTTWNNQDNAFGTDGISLDDAEAVAVATDEIILGAGANRFVTAQVTADIQAWVNGAPNFGWVLLTDNPSDSGGFRTSNHALYNTSEIKPPTAPPGTPAEPIAPLNKTFAALTAAEWRQVQSPTLTINYTPAAPTADTKLTDADLFAALDYDAVPQLAAVRAAFLAGDLALARGELARYLRSRPQPVVPDPSDFGLVIDSTPPASGTARLAAATTAERALTLRFTADATTHQFPDLPLDWEFTPAGTSNFPQYMNRFAYAEDMAKAYAATGNPLYLTGQPAPERLHGFASILRDWITGNPVPAVRLNGGGLQSWTTMQAGLRAGHFWPRAWQRLVRSPDFPPDTLVLWMKSYFEHAEYLRQFRGTGNSLAMEINGLFTASILFPEFSAAAGWRQTALERLAAETGGGGQIYPDGAQTELTPLYHLTSLRHFANVIRIARANSLTLPAPAESAVERMFDYAMRLAEPGGRFPDFNDSDQPNSGSLTAWMQLAANLHPSRPDFLHFATSGTLGAPPANTSGLLPHAGQAVMRSGWDAQARYLAFEGGPLGTAHHHDDKLSFVLNAFGERLILDSGRYAYDGSDYEAYGRSANAHSVVHLGPFRQSRRLSTGVFRADSPYDIEWRTSTGFDYATASFGQREGEVFRHGSTSSSSVLAGASHRRHILFDKAGGWWIVVDDIVQPDATPREIVQQFHLGAFQTSIDSATRRVILQKTSGPSLTLTPMVEHDLTASVTTGQTSPELLGWQLTGGSGTATAIPVARFTRPAAGRVQLATVLAPAPAGAAPATPAVTRLATGNPDLFGARVTWTDGRPPTDFLVNLDRSRPFVWDGQTFSTGSIIVQNGSIHAYGQTVAVTSGAFTEGLDNVIRFTFTRSGGDLGQPLAVPFTLAGNATPASDFTAPPTAEITFPAGQAVAHLDLPLLDDTGPESEESLILTIQPGPGYAPDTARGTASATLRDNDFVTTSNTEGADVPLGGTGSGQITVSRPPGTGPSSTYTLVLPSSTYTALKTGQTDGPPFEWEDISATGSLVTQWTHDSISNLDLVFPSPATVIDDAVSHIINFTGGFFFPFHGENTTRLRVSSNGYITFGTPAIEPARKGAATSYSNSPLPATGAPQGAVFPFWDDLWLDTSGGIYVQQFPDRFIVQWNNITTYSNRNIRVTLQAVLHAGGAISYRYLAVPASGPSYTVGLQNRAATTALQIGHNTAAVGSYTAVRILAPNPWLSASGPTTATLGPGQSAAFHLTYTAAGLPQGTHAATAFLHGEGLPSGGLAVPITISAGGSAPIPTIGVQAATTATSESTPGNPARFTISRTGDTAAPLVVHVAYAGQATPGLDYLALPETVTLPAGESSVTLNVVPLDDLLVEASGNETVTATLQPHPAYTIGVFNPATATIADNDTYANTAPAGAAVRVTSESSVTLTWTDNFETNTKYRVRRSTNQTTWTGFDAAAGATSHTFTGLAPGIPHFFQVRAERATFEGTNNSLWSAVLPATPSALNAWRAAHFAANASEGRAADQADPDADGLPNLLEYALGTHPVEPASRALPFARASAGVLALTFTPAATNGVRFHMDSSTTLTNWTTTDITPFLTPGQPYTHTQSASPDLFLRLRVTTP